MFRTTKVDMEKVRAQLAASWKLALRRWRQESESDRQLLQDAMAELEELCADAIVCANVDRPSRAELEYLMRTSDALQVWLREDGPAALVEPIQKAG